MNDLIRKKDALHAALHNDGQATVVAIEAIEPIDLMTKFTAHICEYCDTDVRDRLMDGLCEDCPIICLIREVLDEQ